MGGIIKFPVPKRKQVSNFSSVPSGSVIRVVPVISIFAIREIEAVLSVVFDLKLVHFHWQEDLWQLTFQFMRRCYRSAICEKPELLRQALERIVTFSFEKVAEYFNERKSERESALSLIEVKQLLDFEVRGESLVLYFQSYRFAGRKKKLLQSTDDHSPAKYTYEKFSFWGDVKPGDEEKYAVSFLYRVNHEVPMQLKDSAALLREKKSYLASLDRQTAQDEEEDDNGQHS